MLPIAFRTTPIRHDQAKLNNDKPLPLGSMPSPRGKGLSYL